MDKKIRELFNEPKIIGIVGDTNEAKSNLIYYLIEELRKEGKFNLVTYGLKTHLTGSLEINSVEELEQIENSIIVLDEVMSMWDLDNRMAKKQIENTLRLIFHNNNILILSFLPENIKKFISSKLHSVFFKKVTISDFINGSKTKKLVLNYKGKELGASVLNIEKGKTILFDGKHYTKHDIPYLPKYDSKKVNQNIIKSVNKNVQKTCKEVTINEKETRNKEETKGK